MNRSDTQSIVPIAGLQDQVAVKLKNSYQMAKRSSFPYHEYRWKTLFYLCHG
jgi:hypothetical protein